MVRNQMPCACCNDRVNSCPVVTLENVERRNEFFYYHMANIFVFASRTGIQGLVRIEATALGVRLCSPRRPSPIGRECEVPQRGTVASMARCTAASRFSFRRDPSGAQHACRRYSPIPTAQSPRRWEKGLGLETARCHRQSARQRGIPPRAARTSAAREVSCGVVRQ